MNYRNTILGIIAMSPISSSAQEVKPDTLQMQEVQEVVVSARRSGVSRLHGAENGFKINQQELFKAACCNLGSSFVTNPSVDVSYPDAAIGSRQIKLLGLSGIYVQMLCENLPDFRGAATPYALGYVPGPWMQSIQVSKGAASVKNGYESITGQINIEYLKPDEQANSASANLYGNTTGMMEGNFDGNLLINNRLSTEILGHFENSWGHHDGNGDGFQDMPNTRQYHLANRWKWKGDRNLLQTGISALTEQRTSGQAHEASPHPFHIKTDANRYQAYLKNAFFINPEHNSNLALMLNATMYTTDAVFGHKTYAGHQKNMYAQLVYETDFTPEHKLSAGISFIHDYLGQKFRLEHDRNTSELRLKERENVPGAYVQYTFEKDSRLTFMAGLRVDHSNLWGLFLTPRMHVKYSPSAPYTLRFSAGKGYRTPHALAENHFLLASGRKLIIGNLGQEAAWNLGISAAADIAFLGKTLKINGEYYFTDFQRQMVIDYDSDPLAVRIGNLKGKSYSHTLQVDMTYPIIEGMSLTAAFRRNIVRMTYNGTTMDKPLNSKYKGLLTASYKTPLGLWQFDATLQLNGGGRMPQPYEKENGKMAWDEKFKAYEQLNLQITRWFKYFSVYLGAENLTAKRQKQLIVNAAAPWGADFEPTMTWGPAHGVIGYLGVRVNINRL